MCDTSSRNSQQKDCGPPKNLPGWLQCPARVKERNYPAPNGVEILPISYGGRNGKAAPGSVKCGKCGLSESQNAPPPKPKASPDCPMMRPRCPGGNDEAAAEKSSGGGFIAKIKAFLGMGDSKLVEACRKMQLREEQSHDRRYIFDPSLNLGNDGYFTPFMTKVDCECAPTPPPPTNCFCQEDPEEEEEECEEEEDEEEYEDEDCEEEFEEEEDSTIEIDGCKCTCECPEEVEEECVQDKEGECIIEESAECLDPACKFFLEEPPAGDGDGAKKKKKKKCDDFSKVGVTPEDEEKKTCAAMNNFIIRVQAPFSECTTNETCEQILERLTKKSRRVYPEPTPPPQPEEKKGEEEKGEIELVVKQISVEELTCEKPKKKKCKKKGSAEKESEECKPGTPPPPPVVQEDPCPCGNPPMYPPPPQQEECCCPPPQDPCPPTYPPPPMYGAYPGYPYPPPPPQAGGDGGAPPMPMPGYPYPFPPPQQAPPGSDGSIPAPYPYPYPPPQQAPPGSDGSIPAPYPYPYPPPPGMPAPPPAGICPQPEGVQCPPGCYPYPPPPYGMPMPPPQHFQFPPDLQPPPGETVQDEEVPPPPPPPNDCETLSEEELLKKPLKDIQCGCAKDCDDECRESQMCPPAGQMSVWTPPSPPPCPSCGAAVRGDTENCYPCSITRRMRSGCPEVCMDKPKKVTDIILKPLEAEDWCTPKYLEDGSIRYQGGMCLAWTKAFLWAAYKKQKPGGYFDRFTGECGEEARLEATTGKSKPCGFGAEEPATGDGTPPTPYKGGLNIEQMTQFFQDRMRWFGKPPDSK